MRMRMIKIDPEFLLQVLRGKADPFTSNLPEDMRLLDIKYDLFSKRISAIIRSDRFEDVEDSYPIPEFKVIYKIETEAETELTTSTKLEAKPIEKAQIQTDRTISAVEKEFSPEQRELLIFTVDGDFIVVKPVQYLKTQWYEVNAVVRSLGGRWVKDESVSYWKIPI
jgi:hypothetical protein